MTTAYHRDSSDQKSDTAEAPGREANRPSEIPWPGWRQVVTRVIKNLGSHNTSLIAAGVAMFGLLSIFPALNVAVTLYALFASPNDIIDHLETMRQILPSQAHEIFRVQLTELATGSRATVNIALVVSALFAFWSARKGAAALIMACDTAYGERETRSPWHLALISSVFTLAGIVGLVILALLAVALPLLLTIVPLGDLLTGLLNLLRWPLLALLFMLVLQCVYRFAPDREDAQWRWVSWGAGIGTILWITASLLFSFYVQNFGNYNETYGAIGGVIVLILWFHISAFVVLLGAEINAELEHQTLVDSTTGKEQPMGQRGAFVADTLPDDAPPKNEKPDDKDQPEPTHRDA